MRKKRWESKLNPRNATSFFLGDITEKRRLTILASQQKLCPGINKSKKGDIIILGSLLGPKITSRLTGEKLFELIKVNGIVEKLDAH